uniref:BCL2-associated athanogene 6 n=1 Tax=Sinocyclocheilus rhinocerous TaxID=307959 RepID=A0A673KGU7_9TELE
MEEQPNNNIEVTVKTLDSLSRSYTVQAQMTVKEFKEHISPSVGIPVDKQRLIYQGRVLQDEKTLTEYNVDGKVIHLVERAPPQTNQQGSDSGGVPGSSGATQGGNQNPNSTSSSQGTPLGPTHDRNANSYVMLGTFNVPTSGSVNVQIDLDQSLQSEPRLRLLLAENLLRDTNLEDGSASQEDSAPPPTSSTSTPSPTVQPMDTSPPPSSTPPSSSSSTQTEGAPPPPAGLSHPSPAEMVEMLTELRRVEERLQPFIQRAHLILEAATTADYNNNTQERDEDQRILNLVGEALRLLGNALVALSDLRCNLLSNPPRHLHVIRPMSHYTSSVQLTFNILQLNLGSTVTMSANGRPAADGQPQSTGQSDQQGQGPTPASQTGPANQQSGQPGPRVIRISHQTLEPVVMMQMNIDGGFLLYVSSQTTTSSSQSFTFSSSTSTSTPSTTTSGSGSTQSNGTSTSTPQPGSPPPPPQENPLGGNLEQLLGSLLGGAVAAGGQGPSITVTMPGVPTFIQGVTDFMQASQPLFSQPPAGQPPTSTPTAPTAPPNAASTPGAATANEGLNPELFTGIVQGVLSTMMGSLGTPQNETESIAQFIQRLSQTSNIFTPGTGDAMGFFGDLLALVCQNFSMVDMVLLLHGQHHPLGRIQPQLAQFFTEHFLQGREPTEANITAAADDLIAELEEYITESFSTNAVRDGVDITQTNRAFLRQQLAGIATHILHCTDQTFGPRLLQLCNRALFECLALNLYCLNGEQSALTAVINHRIRTMSAEVNPSLVNWLTSMMTMRLQVILEHIPITEEQITHYIIRTQMGDNLSPTPATTAEEALASSQEAGAVGGPAREGEGAVGGEETGRDAEAWAAVLPPEWVPIIRQDQISQRKIKAQPPLSDAYLLGMPAKRRKMVKSDGPKLSLSEAVSQAAKSAGVTPISAPNALQEDLEKPELQEAYGEQLKNDIKKRVKEDPDYNSRRFPNTNHVFSPDS